MTQGMQRHGLGDAGYGLVEQAAELAHRQGPTRTAPRKQPALLRVVGRQAPIVAG